MTANAMVKLAPGPEAVGAARRAVTDAADGRVDDDCLDTLRLLVSEVVTNSIRHAGTREGLELSLCVNDDVVVAVTDRGSGFAPRPRTGPPEEVGGWGLFLVEELSSCWGVSRNGFTRVWFAIPSR
jgi:anti-sigma regulatory factor (Ser/Thr protein kinase)